MNLMTPIRSETQPLDPVQLELAIEAATATVPPLWPLDGAIAVNPLAGFEALPFEEAIRAGAHRFGARSALSLVQWRRLAAAGTPPREAVRDAAIAALGGVDAAFAPLGPDLNALDCLMARLFDLPEAEPSTPAGDAVARRVADLCAAFFDAGTAALPMPGREQGLYAAALGMIGQWPESRGKQHWIAALPKTPLAAIEVLAGEAGIAAVNLEAMLAQVVARIPGWAGHIRWRLAHADAEMVEGAPAEMADVIALMLVGDRLVDAVGEPQSVATGSAGVDLARHFGVEPAALGPAGAAVAEMDQAALGLVFQHAAERHFRDALVTSLTAPTAPNKAIDVEADLVFCIDVRSEPMRRAVEAIGPYRTTGYAGFFGLPIAVREPMGGRSRQLPVLVAPQHDLALAPVAGREREAIGEQSAKRRAQGMQALFGWLKGGSASAFATAEATGPVAAALMVANTLAPRTVRRIERRWQGEGTALAPSLDRHAGCSGLGRDERLAYARALFALTGMATDAPLIVLVGHRGEAANNPYAAALDCGACAGHGGGPNARALAAILNDPEVRRELALPADGYALAAEHNTTTDVVTLFDTHLVPQAHAARLARLTQDLQAAGAVVRLTRAERLGRAPDDLATGAAHWGEVRAEWGLAGNATFIVAPRERTCGLDLAGRSFLHSYDWRRDDSGEALATILTAPMVVAQWINCQYLFSTIDNDRYGAGDKTLHNPVGRIGVVLGNGGDLRVGLPRQSLFDDDGLPRHVPQRLLTVVEAPFERIAHVIESHPILQRLFGNGWVQLVAIDPETGKARRWRTDREMAGTRPASEI